MFIHYIPTNQPYYLAEQRRYDGRLVLVEANSRQGAMDAMLRILFDVEVPIRRARFSFPPLRVVK